MNIEWINPRERLPEVGWHIWVINKYHEVFHGLVEYSNGVLCVEIQYEKHKLNNTQETFYFVCDVPFSEEIGNHPAATAYHYQFIKAWAPFIFDDLPNWNHLNDDESLQLLKKDPIFASYLESWRKKDYFDNLYRYAGINAFGKRVYDWPYRFIDANYLPRPKYSGAYVVSDTKIINLINFDEENPDSWKMPNGNHIVYWLPLPERIRQ